MTVNVVTESYRKVNGRWVLVQRGIGRDGLTKLTAEQMARQRKPRRVRGLTLNAARVTIIT